MIRRRWSIAACTILLAAACEKIDPAGDERHEWPLREVRLTAVSGDPGARSQLAPDGYNLLWSPGDRIGVFLRSGTQFTAVNEPLALEGSEPVATGIFRGDLPMDEGASSYTLYAYYPYSGQTSADATGIRFTLEAEQRQSASGNSEHLGSYDFTVAEIVTSPTGTRWDVRFRHAFAVVEVDLTASGAMAGKTVESVALYATDATTVQSDGTLLDVTNMTGDFTFDLTAGADNNVASYAGGSAQIGYCRLLFAEAPRLGADPVVAYLMVCPEDYSKADGQVYLVVRTTDGFTATYAKPGIDILPGQMKVIRQEVTDGTAPEARISLSAGGQTANCYVVGRAAQEYALDATVAGNGVVTDGLREAVQRFEGRSLGTSLAGSHARLLWQSNPYLIEPGSIACEGGMIRFSTTARPVALGGNAVIGLFASDDPGAEALWSWHIWITDKTNEELQALAETYVLYPAYEAAYGAGSTRMMDRNLGAIDKNESDYARSFRAPLYQWGRKDPFPWGIMVYDEQSVPHRYITTWVPVATSGALGQYAGYTGNTYYATAHPDTFIRTLDGTAYDWYYGGGKGNSPDVRNNELWGNPTGYTVGRQTVKTLFDPCPPGWKMPHPYVYSAFTSTGQNEQVGSGEVNVSGPFRQGWNFVYDGSATTFYPGVGYRYDEYGNFFFTPSGYYWTSSPSQPDTFGAWAFGMTSLAVYTYVSDPRGFGLPVRCMRDE